MRGDVTLFYTSPQSDAYGAWCYIVTSNQYDDFARTWKRTYDLTYNGPPIVKPVGSITLNFDLLMNESSRYYFITAASDLSGMRVSLEIEDRWIPSSWNPYYNAALAITLIECLLVVLKILAEITKAVHH